MIMRGLVTAVLALLFVGCCGTAAPAPYLAVREADHRWEGPLPLRPESRASIVKFLKAGGQQDVAEIADPGAEVEFGPLLDLLADPANLSREKLEGPAFARWFGNKRDVIDAREDRASPLAPVFLGYESGAYGWVFRGPDAGFARLTVFRLFWKDPR